MESAVILHRCFLTHVIGLTLALVSCQYQTGAPLRSVTPEDAFMQYGVRISPFKIIKEREANPDPFVGLEKQGRFVEHWKLAGTVKNTSSKGYRSAEIWVHIYDAEGTRIGEQMVTAISLWPDETVKITERVSNLTATQLKGATAKVKSVTIQP